MNAPLFVTGATGHTGVRLVRHLAESGRTLRCLVRSDDSARLLPAHQNIEPVPGDLTLEGEWTEALEDVSAVIHLAHAGLGAPIARACEEHSVERLICLSSTRRFTNFPEQSAGRVIEGERAIENSRIDYTILRSSMIYGAARDNNIERIVEWLRKRPWMPLIRGGRNLVQPIFVDDVIAAIEQSLDATPKITRRALTIAGPEAITWKRMIETVARLMRKKVFWLPVPHGVAMAGAGLIEAMPGRDWTTRDQVRRLLEDKDFDIRESLEALPDWRPRSFEDGLRVKLGGMGGGQ